MSKRLISILNIILIAALFAGSLIGVAHSHGEELASLEVTEAEEHHHEDHHEEENNCSLCELASGDNDLGIVNFLAPITSGSWTLKAVKVVYGPFKPTINPSPQRAPPSLA